MNKISTQSVQLKAGVPFPIFVQGGIDCHSEVHFRVAPSAIGKKIDFTFKDADGRTLNLPTKFIDVETVLMYSNDVPNLHNTNFGFVELLSGEDLHLEIWSLNNEAHFI